MQLLRGEVGEGRIVPIEAPDRGIAEQDAAASVRLQAVLVRIHDQRIGIRNGVEGGTGFRAEIAGQCEVSTVSRVRMDAEPVARLQCEHAVQRIDCADGRGTQGHDDGADVVGLERGFECVQVHAAGVVAGDGDEGQPQHAGDARVGVVRLIGRGYSLAGPQLAGDPERLQIGEGATAGEVAEIGWPAEHPGQGGDGFEFHGGAGAAAVQRVVVGVDRHRHGIGCARNGMRRFKHLPGVERVVVGIVVLHPLGGFGQDRCGVFAEVRRRAGRELVECLIERLLRAAEARQKLVQLRGQGRHF